jgi:formate-dependent nitrite reductase membrane component NrfD
MTIWPFAVVGVGETAFEMPETAFINFQPFLNIIAVFQFIFQNPFFAWFREIPDSPPERKYLAVYEIILTVYGIILTVYGIILTAYENY